MQWHDGEWNVKLLADGASVAQVFVPRAVAKIVELILKPDFEVIGCHRGVTSIDEQF